MRMLYQLQNGGEANGSDCGGGMAENAENGGSQAGIWNGINIDDD